VIYPNVFRVWMVVLVLALGACQVTETENAAVRRYIHKYSLQPVLQEVFRDAPLRSTYGEFVQSIGGIAGVLVTDPDDPPPAADELVMNYYAESIARPNEDVYAWYNEHEEVMVGIFVDGECASTHSGSFNR
jgi:hypothetical protein